MSDSGLYIVATPIGNLEDISLRALRVLSEVDCIAAEDTRHTRRLLQRHGIQTPLLAMHEHNESAVSGRLLDRVENGESIAVVSDAGTPLISDPGFRLVSVARERGIPVIPIPGASALTTALSIGGLPTDRFVFEGFLPSRTTGRRTRIKALAFEPRTLVFFEASHRVQECVSDLAEILGAKRRAALCRELTKQFETVLAGSLEEIQLALDGDPNQRKGEFVLLVSGNEQAEDVSLTQALQLAEALLEHLSTSQAARVAARICGADRQAVYKGLEKRRE